MTTHDAKTSFRLPKFDLHEVERYGRQDGRTTGHILREAVSRYIAYRQRKAKR